MALHSLSFWNKTAHSGFTNLVKPVFIGIACASVMIPIELTLVKNLYRLIKPTPATENHPYDKMSFFRFAIRGPILEEIVFRVLTHVPISWIVNNHLSDKVISHGIGTYRCTIKFSQLVTSINSGVLFGAAHYFVDKNVLQVFICSVAGIVYGILKEKHGLMAAISAHVFHNAVYFHMLQK